MNKKLMTIVENLPLDALGVSWQQYATASRVIGLPEANFKSIDLVLAVHNASKNLAPQIIPGYNYKPCRS